MDFEIGWHKLNKYTVLYNTARNVPKKNLNYSQIEWHMLINTKNKNSAAHDMMRKKSEYTPVLYTFLFRSLDR